jgi:hypothetical protein
VKKVGQDENGEPIWELTNEEFEQRRRQWACARAAAKAGTQGGNNGPQSPEATTEPESAPGAGGKSSHAKAAAAPDPHALELGSKIWEMRRRGFSRYEVHRRLGIPMEAVNEILLGFQQHFYPDVGQAMSHYAALDDQRLEDLVSRWLPVATGPAPEVEKIGRNGQAYTELDTDIPVKAANIVLGAIKGRIQLLMACRPESASGKDGSGSTNILMWLNQVMPGIQKVVTEVENAPVSRGRQNLVLECEAEKLAQGNNSNGEPKR